MENFLVTSPWFGVMLVSLQQCLSCQKRICPLPWPSFRPCPVWGPQLQSPPIFLASGIPSPLVSSLHIQALCGLPLEPAQRSRSRGPGRACDKTHVIWPWPVLPWFCQLPLFFSEFCSSSITPSLFQLGLGVCTCLSLAVWDSSSGLWPAHSGACSSVTSRGAHRAPCRHNPPSPYQPYLPSRDTWLTFPDVLLHFCVSVSPTLSLLQATVDPYLHQRVKHRPGSISVGSLGPRTHKVWFEPSKHLWQVWGLILNEILPLLLSFWDFSFALGCGYLFWWDPTFSCWWLFSSQL